MLRRIAIIVLTVLLSGCLFACSKKSTSKKIELLNVSYDPTREMFQDMNQSFIEYWKQTTGQTVAINESHGGSGSQARAVMEGLEADVVTLGLASDINKLAEKGLLNPNWEQDLPHDSAPYTSTIVFLVRKGNPKGIHDWGDLVKKGVSVITPNPKTSGGARWNYLAAWGYAINKYNGNQDQAKEFMTKLYKNVQVLDSGARGSTTTFVKRGIGDVLVTWENEAYMALNKLGKNQFEMVTPSISILAQPSVAVVDQYAKKHGTKKAAEAYLQFLYSDQGQEIAAQHYFRPTSEKIAQKYQNRFPNLRMFTIEDFGGWKQVQDLHFKDGGIFDKIYEP